MYRAKSCRPWSDVQGNIKKIAHSYDSITLYKQHDKCFMVTNTKVGVEATEPIAKKQTKPSFYRAFLRDVFFWLRSAGVNTRFYSYIVNKTFQGLGCVTWDEYEQAHHKKSFTNMEYAIPESKIEEAVAFLIKKLDESKVKRNVFWLIRPVGADERGYLSMTRTEDRSPTYFIDLPY
mmetsp:Transcript_36100/g.32487  ORF Transcript_36100/g.32487 Transcript_36100/m.32487 type:complete len:177 (-) Transcript_36100:345-875(-)